MGIQMDGMITKQRDGQVNRLICRYIGRWENILSGRHSTLSIDHIKEYSASSFINYDKFRSSSSVKQLSLHPTSSPLPHPASH